jgi:thymidine kinase
MSKLIFQYGTMGSSKTANALMIRFNYMQQGFGVTLIKPSTDTRDGIATLKSRIGLSAEALVVHPYDNIKALAEKAGNNIIIADEAQFFTTIQVEQLRDLADNGYMVWCFGLKTDFKSHLFAGSKRLIELADSIEELKTVCRCGRKAIINARLDDIGNVVTDGDLVSLGTHYQAMCYHCWNENTQGRGC